VLQALSLRMANFAYKAYLVNNKTETGKIVAGNKTDAIRQLSDQRKRVFSIEEEGNASHLKTTLIFDRSPDLVRVFEDLSELINAGLNVDLALKVMGENETNKVHRKFYNEISESFSEGKTLSSSCSKYEFIPSDTIALIKAGEQSGELGEVIKIISSDLKQSKERRQALFEVLSYPVFLIVVMILAIAAITGFLVPAIEPIFESSDKDIPWVLAFFKLLKSLANELGLGIIFVVLSLMILSLFASVRLYLLPYIHKMLLGIPLIGNAIRDANFARYFQGLSLLLLNNVPLQESLKLAAQSSRNIFLRRQLEKITNQVIAGRSVPEVISETKLFEPEIVSVIRVGDQVNKLPSVLKRASELLDVRSQRKIKSVMAFITPTITILMGLLVGALAFSVMSALLSINELAI